MFYSPKHVQSSTSSPIRRRIAGVALAGATATIGSMAAAQSASANGVWDGVAQCESGGNWSTTTGNGFSGGLQFTAQTWQGHGGGKYASSANQATKAQQIEIAQKVLQTQGPGAWPVCSQKAGLTAANGMGGGGSTAPAPTQEAPAQQAPTQQAPAQQAPTQQAPAQQAPTQQAPAQQAPAQQAPTQEAPAQAAQRPSDNTASRSQARNDTQATTGSLAVDGIRGPNTNAAIEKWVGGSVDGSLSTSDVKALQAKVGTAQDGVIGPKTTTALQATVGAAQDGIWGSQTTMALQTHLNAQGL